MSAELDKQVAEAIGLKDLCPEMNAGVVFYWKRNLAEGVDGSLYFAPAWVPFRPSTDLNDAFFAAERVGMLATDRDVLALRCTEADGVAKYHVWYGNSDDRGVCNGDSLATAICNAILKLHSEQGD